MCRLLGYSSSVPTNIPQFIGSEFSAFVELSNVHHDSWGLAINSGSETKVIKKAETAAISREFPAVINETSGTGGLLHFRWASPGLPVNQQNAHPFSHGDVSFIHNGALSPYDALANLVSADYMAIRQGQTDSELFFLYLLTEISAKGFRVGVLDAIRNIKNNFKYSSINSMVMNSDFLIVISEHDPANKPQWADEVYYEIRYRLDENGFAVASSGWDQAGWQLIENHKVLILNRKSLELELISL